VRGSQKEGGKGSKARGADPLAKATEPREGSSKRGYASKAGEGEGRKKRRSKGLFRKARFGGEGGGWGGDSARCRENRFSAGRGGYLGNRRFGLKQSVKTSHERGPQVIIFVSAETFVKGEDRGRGGECKETRCVAGGVALRKFGVAAP